MSPNLSDVSEALFPASPTLIFRSPLTIKPNLAGTHYAPAVRKHKPKRRKSRKRISIQISLISCVDGNERGGGVCTCQMARPCSRNMYRPTFFHRRIRICFFSGSLEGQESRATRNSSVDAISFKWTIIDTETTRNFTCQHKSCISCSSFLLRAARHVWYYVKRNLNVT